jgi:uncharacterized protein (DUF2236 family)
MRRRYRIRWTPAHAAAHRALSRGLRSGRSAVPRRLKVSPVFDFAMARTAGRLEEDEGAA